VPVFELVPVGPAPSVVSVGITTPRRADGGGAGSVAGAADAGAGVGGGGGALVAQDRAAASTKAAPIAWQDRWAIRDGM
jgi:hypothetical protein